MQAFKTTTANLTLDNIIAPLKSNATNSPTPDMIASLHPDLILNIAGFLGAKDVMSFSAVSKPVRQGLSLSPTSTPLHIVSSTDLHLHGDYCTGDDPILVASLPVPNEPQEGRAIALRCQWKDQGWGNEKGRIIILRHPKRVTSSFQPGQVVAQAAPAPRQWSPLELTFVPKAGEVYSVWCSAGGGGGHELFVRDATISIVIRNDKKRKSVKDPSLRGTFASNLTQKGDSQSISKPPLQLRFSKDIHLYATHNHGENPELAAIIPVFLDPQKIHTIALRCQWEGRYWGAERGHMYIVGHTEKVTSNTVDVFHAGRVVTSTGLAPHQWKRLQLTFVPREGEFYSLWCSAGGREGCVLVVRGASISALIQNEDVQGTQKAAYWEKASQFVPLAVEPRRHPAAEEEDFSDPEDEDDVFFAYEGVGDFDDDSYA